MCKKILSFLNHVVQCLFTIIIFLLSMQRNLDSSYKKDFATKVYVERRNTEKRFKNNIIKNGAPKITTKKNVVGIK